MRNVWSSICNIPPCFRQNSLMVVAIQERVFCFALFTTPAPLTQVAPTGDLISFQTGLFKDNEQSACRRCCRTSWNMGLDRQHGRVRYRWRWNIRIFLIVIAVVSHLASPRRRQRLCRSFCWCRCCCDGGIGFSRKRHVVFIFLWNCDGCGCDRLSSDRRVQNGFVVNLFSSLIVHLHDKWAPCRFMIVLPVWPRF